MRPPRFPLNRASLAGPVNWRCLGAQRELSGEIPVGASIMMKHLPHAWGRALKNVRPGLEKILYFGPTMEDVPESIPLQSPAFAHDGALPQRFTADGEKLSPPSAWSYVPPETVALILLVEDADSPTPHPLTHAIVLDLPPTDGALAEGEIKSPDHPGQAHDLGRNSMLRTGYLPPDPPPGHGPHRYVFQVYAVDSALSELKNPSRDSLRAALQGHVIARGCLIGTYERP